MRVQVTAFEMYEGHEPIEQVRNHRRAAGLQLNCGSSTFRRLFFENFDGYVRNLSQRFAIGA
jgi:hypothetical protein